MSAALALVGCWEDRGSCELWANKLGQATETSLAVGELAKNRCVGERAALLAHLDDANLGADVLAALIALGQSPEAETAVRRSLGRGETAVVAAKQVVAWKLAAEDELRAALADQTLAAHHGPLLEAALAVAPPARWVGTLVRELADTGAHPGAGVGRHRDRRLGDGARGGSRGGAAGTRGSGEPSRGRGRARDAGAAHAGGHSVVGCARRPSDRHARRCRSARGAARVVVPRSTFDCCRAGAARAGRRHAAGACARHRDRRARRRRGHPGPGRDRAGRG